MEKQTFNIAIDAPREKVWDILWDDATYRQWTTPFMEGSYAVSDWKKGSKILFLGPEGSGMVSKVADKIPNEYMSFEHLGEVKGNVEDTTSDKVKQWAGTHENYTLKSVNGQTELTVDIDIPEDFKDYFTNTWPKALDKVKELAES